MFFQKVATATDFAHLNSLSPIGPSCAALGSRAWVFSTATIDRTIGFMNSTQPLGQALGLSFAFGFNFASGAGVVFESLVKGLCSLVHALNEFLVLCGDIGRFADVF